MLDDPAADVLVPAAKRRVGVVFQEYRLFPHLSVLDNVAFGPRSAGRSTPQSRAEAAEWVARLRLDELAAAHARPAVRRAAAAHRPRPSPRERARRAAARRAARRARRRDPDRRTQRPAHAPRAVRRARRCSSRTTPLDALVLADRIVVLEHGAITQQGTALEVARRPASDYVAKLLGLNLLRGVRRRRRHRGRGRRGAARVRPRRDTARCSSRCDRARSRCTRAQPEGSARNVWPGVVDGVEPLGERVRVSVVGAPSVLVDVTPGAVADLHVAPGDRGLALGEGHRARGLPGVTRGRTAASRARCGP